MEQESSPAWFPVLCVILRRIGFLYPQDDDPHRVAATVYGLMKKTGWIPPSSWSVTHDIIDGAEVTDEEFKQGLYSAALLPPEQRKMIADALGQFARVEGAAADSDRRVYVRQIRGVLTRAKMRGSGGKVLPL